jgi:hypothetical protein
MSALAPPAHAVALVLDPPPAHAVAGVVEDAPPAESVAGRSAAPQAVAGEGGDGGDERRTGVALVDVHGRGSCRVLAGARSGLIVSSG